MSNTHVKNIKLGACKVSFGGVDLGYTKGGVQVEVATETLKVTVDQLGQTVISELVQGRNITITAPLAESVLQNMVDLMPGSTLSEDDNSVTITSAQGVNLIDVAKEPGSDSAGHHRLCVDHPESGNRGQLHYDLPV